MMELDVATMEEKKWRESKEHKEVDESPTDRDFAKGQTTTFKFQEDDEHNLRF